MSLALFIISLFNAQHVSDVNTSILGACDLFVELFHGLCCSGKMCVGVTVWSGWGGVASRYHTTPAKPHHNTNTHHTRAIQPMK